jgi:hypothetical protein
MTKEKIIDGEVHDVPPKSEPASAGPLPEQPDEAPKKDSSNDSIGETIRRAFGETFDEMKNVLQNRDNVVMVRVHSDTLHYLDMLVAADITKSRSESAAYLINEGVKANVELFGKIKEVTDQIDTLRTKLRETIQSETKEEAK